MSETQNDPKDSGLPVIWNTPLDHTDIVNTFVSIKGVYAGDYGNVYRLNPLHGAIEASNNLPGYGYYEVRISGSADGSFVAIGTHGYVVSLDPITLGINWFKQLPNTVDISLIIEQGNTYAAGNGTAFIPDLEGNIITSKDLLKGSGETRIALSNLGTELFVGSAGFVGAFSTTKLDQLWSKRLQSAVGPTTVLSGNIEVYVGDSGYVWRIDALDGTILAIANLGSTTGYREIHLASNTDRTMLCAGTNGYGASLSPSTMSVNYITSLPNTNYNVTDVVVRGQMGFFAARGRVFQLNQGGTIISSDALSGFGNYDTSLNLQGFDRLIAGPQGYVVGILVLKPSGDAQSMAGPEDSRAGAEDVLAKV